jgi:hypothetical protein
VRDTAILALTTVVHDWVAEAAVGYEVRHVEVRELLAVCARRDVRDLERERGLSEAGVSEDRDRCTIRTQRADRFHELLAAAHELDDQAWRIVRMAAGFSQRFKGTFTDGGVTIVGVWQLCQDGVNWTDDLKITYRRRA